MKDPGLMVIDPDDGMCGHVDSPGERSECLLPSRETCPQEDRSRKSLTRFGVASLAAVHRGKSVDTSIAVLAIAGAGSRPLPRADVGREDVAVAAKMDLTTMCAIRDSRRRPGRIPSTWPERCRRCLLIS